MLRASEQVRAARVRAQLLWAGAIALTFGIGALIAAAGSQPAAIALAAVGAATSLWLVQTAIIGLSGHGERLS